MTRQWVLRRGLCFLLCGFGLAWVAVATAQQLPGAGSCEQQLVTRVEQAQTLVEAWAQAQTALRQRYQTSLDYLEALRAQNATMIIELQRELDVLKAQQVAPVSRFNIIDTPATKPEG